MVHSSSSAGHSVSGGALAGLPPSAIAGIPFLPLSFPSPSFCFSLPAAPSLIDTGAGTSEEVMRLTAGEIVVAMGRRGAREVEAEGGTGVGRYGDPKLLTASDLRLIAALRLLSDGDSAAASCEAQRWEGQPRARSSACSGERGSLPS